MTPSFSRFDSAYGVLLNAIIGGNFTLQSGIRKDGVDLRCGQFSRSASFATVGGAMFNAIKLIIARRIPSQVCKAVVPRITVVMATLHAFWSWANKRRQNQSMWPHNFLLVSFPKIHKRTQIVNVLCVSLNLVGFNRSHTTVIRNFVHTFKTDNRFPIFHANPLNMTMGMLS